MRLPSVPKNTPLTDERGSLTRTWLLFFEELGQTKSTVAAAQASAGANLKSPLDFGAAGDGASDDTAPVAAAAALGYLWLPAGYTFITRKVTISKSEFWAFGGGALKLKPGEGTDLLYMDGTEHYGTTYPGNGSYFHLNNITLHGNASNQPVNLGACLVLRNAAYASVQDCLIYAGSGDGIRLESYNYSPNADEVNIVNNRIFSNGRHGIYAYPISTPVATTIAASFGTGAQTVTPASMENITVGRFVVVKNSDGSHEDWVVVTAATLTTFTATFSQTHTGPGITVTSVFGHVGDHVFLANHVNYNGECGIRGTWLTSTIIADNNVLTNAVGIYLDAPDRCIISNNAVRNNKGSGIIIDQDQSGNGFGRAVQIQILGNQVHYNNMQTPVGDELDVFHTDGCMISGNYFGDTDFPSVAWYGIQLADCTGIAIEANLFANTIYGPLLAPLDGDGRQHPYRSVGNIGLADDMQGTQAVLPLPAVNDYGLRYRVTDYGHVLLWIGDQWTYADPGDCSGQIVASSAGVLTGGVWAPCNRAETSIAASIATGSQTVTPLSMTDIAVGTRLWVANWDASNAEFLTVTAVTGTTFTATFASAKTYGAPGTEVVVRFAARILQGGGTLLDVVTPNLGAGYYMRM